MKNILLTAALIAAAVASGDLLAKATVPKMPASRAAALVAEKARSVAHDGRLRVSIARLESETPAAK